MRGKPPSYSSQPIGMDKGIFSETEPIYPDKPPQSI